MSLDVCAERIRSWKGLVAAYHGTYKRSFSGMSSHVIVHLVSFHKWLLVSRTIFPFTVISSLHKIWVISSSIRYVYIYIYITLPLPMWLLHIWVISLSKVGAWASQDAHWQEYILVDLSSCSVTIGFAIAMEDTLLTEGWTSRIKWMSYTINRTCRCYFTWYSSICCSHGTGRWR